MVWPVEEPVEEVSVLASWTSERAAPKDRPPLFLGERRMVAHDNAGHPSTSRDGSAARSRRRYTRRGSARDPTQVAETSRGT
jgi:hypothetical protein